MHDCEDARRKCLICNARLCSGADILVLVRIVTEGSYRSFIIIQGILFLNCSYHWSLIQCGLQTISKLDGTYRPSFSVRHDEAANGKTVSFRCDGAFEIDTMLHKLIICSFHKWCFFSTKST